MSELFRRRIVESRSEDTLDVARVRDELMAALVDGGMDDLMVFAGHSAGLVDEISTAADVVRTLVTDAEEALALGS